MNTLFTTMLLSFFLVVSPIQAESGEDKGWYVSLGTLIGSSDRDENFNVYNSSVNRSGEIFLDHDSDAASFRLVTGYKFADRLRLEGEIFRLPYDLADVNYTNVELPEEVLQNYASYNDAVQGSGDFDYMGVVFNVLIDIVTGKKWVFYAGVGVGAVRVDVDTEVNVTGNVRTGSGSDTVPMLQLQTGVGYKVNDRLMVFTNHRWMAVRDASIDQYSGTGANTSTLDLNSFESSTLEIGLKAKIGKGKRNQRH